MYLRKRIIDRTHTQGGACCSSVPVCGERAGDGDAAPCGEVEVVVAEDHVGVGEAEFDETGEGFGCEFNVELIVFCADFVRNLRVAQGEVLGRREVGSLAGKKLVAVKKFGNENQFSDGVIGDLLGEIQG